MPSKIRGGTKDKHLADIHIPRVSALGAGGGAAAFDPSSVAGYSRDWNFADITKLYTDTAGTLPVAADADPIGAILCSAGSTVKLAAPADASRGTYKTNIQNGLSVGRLDGSDDYWSNAAAITADESQTMFFIAKKRSAPGTTGVSMFILAVNAQLYTDSDEHATQYRWFAPGTTIPATATSWNIFAFKFSSVSSCSAYINGGAPTTFDPHNDYSTATNLTLGAGAADWDFGRVLVYSTALSNTDLDYIIGGLGTLYNITTSAVS